MRLVNNRMTTEFSRRCFLRNLSLLAAPLGVLPLAAQNPVGPDATTGSDQASFNVRRHGARGNGQAKDTAAIQTAIDAAGREGGCVYFPPGRYLSGTLRLRSHVTLQLENGATLAASPDRADFDEYEKLGYQSFSDQETTDFNYALIRGRDLEQVAILGPGRIDMARGKRGGPKPVALKLCRDILVRDLIIENSPNYNLSFLGCDFVDIMGVTIRNGYCDGIDPDCCRHVRIANCFVESWDDAIVPKASFALGHKRATEHVTVTNCVLTTGCNGLKLGTESSGDFKDIVFSNCSIYSSPELWKHRAATSGVSLEMVDGGALERIAVSNLVLKDVRVPVFVRLGNRGRAQAVPQPERMENISFSDIVATGADLTSSITGIPGHPVRGLTLRNLRFTAAGGAKLEPEARSVPEFENKYPDGDMFGALPAYGLYCRHVSDLMLDDIRLSLGQPDGRPAMILEDVAQIDLRNVLASPPTGGLETVRFSDVTDAFVQGCRALAGSAAWALVKGARSQRLRFGANDFTQCRHPIQIGAEVSRKEVKLES
jgi:hypothetical protein